jgi:predicted porin
LRNIEQIRWQCRVAVEQLINMIFIFSSDFCLKRFMQSRELESLNLTPQRRFSMKKKLIALAVAGATLAPLAAMAQTSNPVTLYGRAYATFESVKADGGPLAPLGSRSRVTDQSSFFGIRGTEDLGGGLKAFFQLESVFRLDSNTSTFANRNSGVGLQGDFGSVLLGRWDTPFKVSTIAIDPFGDLTLGGLTGVLSDRGNFDRREQNVVQYWSPNLGGFQARASYAVNEGKTATTNPSGLSFSGTYTQGPFYVGYTWERHKDQFKAYNGASIVVTGGVPALVAGPSTGGAFTVAGAREKGQAIFGSFTIGPVKLGAMTQYFIKDNPLSGPAGRKNGSEAQMFSAVYTIGKSQILFSHQRAKDGTFLTVGNAARPADAKSTSNNFGYQYNFTRRTFALAQYTQVKNNSLGQADFGADKLGVGADQDPKGFSFGLRHLF